MQKFISDNKVLISALLSSVILILQQYLLPGAEVSMKAIGFATLIAALGVVANQWKGKGVTVLGIFGTLAGVFTDIYSTGTFTWNEFILSSIVAVLMAVSASIMPQKVDVPQKVN